MRYLLTIGLLIGLLPFSVAAQEDMPGSQDHPDFPRIAGSIIAGFDPIAFGEASYLEGADEEVAVNWADGEVTKILYLPPLDHAPASVYLNHEAAFKELGAFEPYYSCRRGTCDRDLADDFVWARNNRFETTLGRPGKSFFEYSHKRVDQVYLSGKITAETGVYIVSVYAAKVKETDKDLQGGQSVAVFQAIRTEEFKAELEVVAASEIEDSISKSGHVALYGLFFETNSDVLIDTSEPALKEIAAYLQSSPDVNVYVVGHTDNVGEVEYNQGLSLRRTRSVARSLSSNFGIDTARLAPLGAGLAAPVSTNKTEEGRAKNRRV